ncbi:MAG: hypothetical protein QM734_02330 [Cyclobacteriaceae bacterium]
MKKSKILLAIIVLAGIIGACNESANPIPLILTVWTADADTSTVTGTSAKIQGVVTSDGGKAVSAYGVCYSAIQNASLSNSDSVIVGASIGSDGSFTVNITGLANTSTYYARAYATNSMGTVYGNYVTFLTKPYPLPVPSLTTTTPSAVTTTTATSGGNIAYGGLAITEMGVCVGTSENPTTSDMKFTVSNPGAGPFTANITGLNAGTDYHVRAYAISAGGTGYGNDIKFTTSN